MDKRNLRSNSNNASPASNENMKEVQSQQDAPVTINDLKVALADCVSRINEEMHKILNDRLEKLRCDIKKDFESRFQQLESTIAAQASEIEALKECHHRLSVGVDTMALSCHEKMRKDIECNIILSGIPEDSEEEDIPELAQAALGKLRCSEDDVLTHSRVGKSQGNKSRLLKMSFRSVDDKYKAVRNAPNLRNDAKFQNVYVNPDRTFAERCERKRLWQKSFALKKENPAAKIDLRRGKLLVNGEVLDSAEPHRYLFRPTEHKDKNRTSYERPTVWKIDGP